MRSHLTKLAEGMATAVRESLAALESKFTEKLAERDANLARISLQLVGLSQASAFLPKAEEVAAQLRAAVEPLTAQIAELQAQQKAAPDFEALVAAEVERRMAALPVPQDGESVDMEQVEAMLSRTLAAFEEAGTKALAALPVPKDGKDGTSVTVEEVWPSIQSMLAGAISDFDTVAAKAIAAIPVPENGKDGDPGKDGKSLTPEDLLPHAKSWFSEWALGFERNAAEVLERAASRIPVPANGKDGLGFDDLSVVQTGERTITLEFRRGDEVKAFAVELPGFIDRGIYREEMAYAKGDAVTRGGSLWIAQRAVSASEVPGRENDGWRLAVKKGGDGPKGEKGEPGGHGNNGKDGRNYDGSRG